MTELQISLIVIGAVIIIGVIAYNKWQEYRAHRKVERAFADAPDDVLMQSTPTEDSDIRREPTFFHNSVPGVKLEDPVMDAEISINGLDYNEEDQVAFNEESDDVEIDAYTQTLEYSNVDISEDSQEPGIDEAQFSNSQEATPEPEEEVSIPLSSILPLQQNLPVDELIDYSVSLSLDEPVRAEKLLPLIQSIRYTGNKPVHFIGLAKDEQTNDASWQAIMHGGLYHRLKAGVQLANRTGALNEIEYSELITRLRLMADGIGAELDVPDMTDVLKEARSLHQFVTEHDARLGINVRANGSPWSVKTLIAVLEHQKFDLRPDGFFVLHDTDGSLLFALTINASPASETAARLTFLLDVPCVAHEKNGFGVMVQHAKLLCQRLNGILVDDDDRMLSDPMLSDIEGQVNVFYEEMKAVSIPAGSVRAMRLFH